MIINLIICLFACVSVVKCSDLEIVNRTEWGGRAPILVEPIHGPVPYVIVHHSYIPSACYTHNACSAAMRNMQDYHQIDQGWNDIGYSFAIGGDGRIYEGRGFNVVGAHAPNYNNKSVGICLIGDWQVDLPSENMISATKKLIAAGVRNGHIQHDYKLLGHRQVRETDCPGNRLFHEIESWDNFVPIPPILRNHNTIKLVKA